MTWLRHALEAAKVQLGARTVALIELQQRFDHLTDELRREQQLFSHLMHKREQEREQLAQDIHDALAQNLLALRIDVAMFASRTAGAHGRLHERTEQVLSHVDVAIRNARGLINELHPPVLELGLLAAMEWLTARFRRETLLGCTLAVPDDAACNAIAPPAELALYRILREALENVHRHAHATLVEVVLKTDGDWVELSVADNGIGIAAGQRGKPDAYGLQMVAECLAGMRGELILEANKPGKGCRFIARMPFSSAAAAPPL
ncbi:sensor histidine kinase [Pseudoduganella ginsengisoli]|uniref:sensor histidine kinase n=1 Tax=Pseudoduganella ginsengisoli TaxID=1462440 RepID=UPI001478F225